MNNNTNPSCELFQTYQIGNHLKLYDTSGGGRLDGEFKECIVVKKAITHDTQLSETIVRYKGKEITLEKFKGTTYGYNSLYVCQ